MPFSPEGDAHQQVEQQARQSGTRGHPHREDGQQRDPRPDQQEGVELVDVEGHRGVTSHRQQGRRYPTLAARPDRSRPLGFRPAPSGQRASWSRLVREPPDGGGARCTATTVIRGTGPAAARAGSGDPGRGRRAGWAGRGGAVGRRWPPTRCGGWRQDHAGGLRTLRRAARGRGRGARAPRPRGRPPPGPDRRRRAPGPAAARRRRRRRAPLVSHVVPDAVDHWLDGSATAARQQGVARRARAAVCLTPRRPGHHGEAAAAERHPARASSHRRSPPRRPELSGADLLLTLDLAVRRGPGGWPGCAPGTAYAALG